VQKQLSGLLSDLGTPVDQINIVLDGSPSPMVREGDSIQRLPNYFGHLLVPPMFFLLLSSLAVTVTFCIVNLALHLQLPVFVSI